MYIYKDFIVYVGVGVWLFGYRFIVMLGRK